jgi:hypothetical protein
MSACKTAQYHSPDLPGVPVNKKPGENSGVKEETVSSPG